MAYPNYQCEIAKVNVVSAYKSSKEEAHQGLGVIEGKSSLLLQIGTLICVKRPQTDGICAKTAGN